MARKDNFRTISKKESVAVIGEGICEYYYLQSIRGLSKYPIKPLTVKDGIDYLEKEIEKCVIEGFEKIFCLIDKDNKSNGDSKKQYDEFIGKYKEKCKIIKHKNNAIEYTTVHIIENHPCLEIWFYYFFKYTASIYQSWDNLNPLKVDFEKVFPEYEKKDKYLKCLYDKKGGLHRYIVEQKKGNFQQALKHSEKSMKNRNNNECNGNAYSEMKELFDAILKDEYK